MRFRVLAALAAVVVTALLPASSATDANASAAAQRGGQSPRNLIVVVVDDMGDFSCDDTDQYLPKSSRWLRDGGRCFQHASVTTPVCCPARAEIQSGQVPHNNGVRRQIDAPRLDARNTMQAYLGQRGLTTYAIGKFLNGVSPRAVKDGSFDTGFTRTDVWNTELYRDYVLYDELARPYRTDVHTTLQAGSYLTGFVSEMLEKDKPFYAYAAFAAPHTQNRNGKGFLFPEPTAANAWRQVPKFKFHPEKDTSDKLLPFAHLEEAHGRQYFAAFHAARVRALYDVDDQVAVTFSILEESGALDDTAVFFVSDNGYHLGSNGWEGKAVPYPDSLEVPMLAYYPPAFGSGVVDTRRVGLVDIAPTVFDLFGIQPGYRVDGHSLLDRGARRESFHEFVNERSEFVLQESGHAPFRVPTWSSYTDDRGHTFVEFYKRNGKVLAQEYYRDRGMQRNLLADQYRNRRPKASVITAARKRLRELQSCAGTVEQGSPNPCT